MERKRGFEIAKGFENSNINLPVRSTKNSAGYDVEAAEDCVIPAFKPGQKPTLVKTGIKAYMESDEVLILANRSSNPGKKGLILANSIGVVDADYYGNADNDGARQERERVNPTSARHRDGAHLHHRRLSGGGEQGGEILHCREPEIDNVGCANGHNRYAEPDFGTNV